MHARKILRLTNRFPDCKSKTAGSNFNTPQPRMAQSGVQSFFTPKSQAERSLSTGGVHIAPVHHQAMRQCLVPKARTLAVNE